MPARMPPARIPARPHLVAQVDALELSDQHRRALVRDGARRRVARGAARGLRREARRHLRGATGRRGGVSGTRGGGVSGVRGGGAAGAAVREARPASGAAATVPRPSTAPPAHLAAELGVVPREELGPARGQRAEQRRRRRAHGRARGAALLCGARTAAGARVARRLHDLRGDKASRGL
jgi:hypothetical protein